MVWPIVADVLRDDKGRTLVHLGAKARTVDLAELTLASCAAKKAMGVVETKQVELEEGRHRATRSDCPAQARVLGALVTDG
jgi:hypothetical protein